MNGIPEGYEFVRVGRVHAGELTIGVSGNVARCSSGTSSKNNVIVKKIPSHCEFPKGVFCDGWITEDSGKGLCWWKDKPAFDTDNQVWVANCKVVPVGLAQSSMRTGIRFAPLTPMEQRFQQVGPHYEALNP